MTTFTISQSKLSGSVEISGSKNAAIPILLSTLLLDSKVILHNIPRVTDVENTIKLLKSCGTTVTRSSSSVTVSPRARFTSDSSADAGLIRSSILLLGVAVARGIEISLPLPGGCKFGPRPIDIHLSALKALGARIEEHKDHIKLIPPVKRESVGINLSLPSVSATINAVFASVLDTGATTVINNTAKEPEVIDLCNFLVACGAIIDGIGTSELEITGAAPLTPKPFTIIPDRIEAATYILAGVLTQSAISITSIRKDHLQALFDLLKKIGVKVDISENAIHLKDFSLTHFNCRTDFYPGIPTDLQPLLVVLGSIIGDCSITETVYQERFTNIDALRKMGAAISMQNEEYASTNQTKIITKKSKLKGTEITALDLRAGASLLLAALVSDGTTTINGAEQILRGYEDVVKKFENLGVVISRI